MIASAHSVFYPFQLGLRIRIGTPPTIFLNKLSQIMKSFGILLQLFSKCLRESPGAENLTHMHTTPRNDNDTESQDSYTFTRTHKQSITRIRLLISQFHDEDKNMFIFIPQKI